MEEHPAKLLDWVSDAFRRKHYSHRTGRSSVNYIKRYNFCHNVQHPAKMEAAEIEAFLTRLAVAEHVSLSTPNQAFRALLFPYREVLLKDPGPVGAFRAKRHKRLPVVLMREETLSVLGRLSSTCQLMARLLCGRGLRLMEFLRLTVDPVLSGAEADLDFAPRQIPVRHGKGPGTGSRCCPKASSPPRKGTCCLPAHA